MTDNGAPACRCGLAMRVAAVRDAWECRCGVWLDVDSVYAVRLADAPIPDDAYHQGEPWKEPEPGIVISDKFGDIGERCWETLDIDPARFPAPEAWQRLCADAFECSGLQYVGPSIRTRDIQPSMGRTLVMEDGEEVPRRSIYALVPVGKEAEAIRGIVQAIRGMHGPGRLWAHGDIPIGPLKKRAQAGWRGAEVGGVLHVVLGCYYFHKPTPIN